MPVLDVCYGLASDDLARPRHDGCYEGAAGAYDAREDLFLGKYRHWRGRSGRSHAFSVYSPETCPAYVDAVLIVALRRGTLRTSLACVDLGPFPDGALAKLRRRYFDRRHEIEFHIHVLADRAADRRTLIADLAPGRV